MFEQTIKLIGAPLNHPGLQAFMIEHGFKQPKKTEISGRTSERSFWVEHKKLAVDLLFAIDLEENNPHYNQRFCGSKKGMWVPVLKQVTFKNPQLEYPFGLKIGLTQDEVTKILGNFTFKSSDITRTWINDDGSESFYGWVKTMDAAKDIVLHTRLWVGEVIRDIDIHPTRYDNVFYLYDALSGDTIDHLLERTA
jgi:hypothetical protein